jgi:hypothetical protein
MDKHEVRKPDMTKKEAKAKDKEEKKQLKEKEKELKKSTDKKKASAGKQQVNGNGNDEQPRMQRANSLPEGAETSAADVDPLALDDEHDEQEEWEIDSSSAKSKKQKKTKTNERKKSQKTYKKGGGSDGSGSSSEEEGEEGGEDNCGDDLLVGSPRTKGKGGNTKMKKASSSRSLSRSAGAVATKKVSKQV